jgi:hypothetical protein
MKTHDCNFWLRLDWYSTYYMSTIKLELPHTETE